MTAWLRAGYKDEAGNIVTKDQFVPDNVVLTFKGDGFLTIKARNLPNHPTAKFPGFNPSYIQEFNRTYRLPLEPVVNPKAVAMNASDRNGALPMGGIGVAVNGVVFYNPFDATMNDASNIMDYCCGHPSPDNRYHYHKYPICVNTPFVDKGDAHSRSSDLPSTAFPSTARMRRRESWPGIRHRTRSMPSTPATTRSAAGTTTSRRENFLTSSAAFSEGGIQQSGSPPRSPGPRMPYGGKLAQPLAPCRGGGGRAFVR
jgi:hypothetical protein